MYLNEQFQTVVWFEEMVPFFENRMISGKFLEPYAWNTSFSDILLQAFLLGS